MRGIGDSKMNEGFTVTERLTLSKMQRQWPGGALAEGPALLVCRGSITQRHLPPVYGFTETEGRWSNEVIMKNSYFIWGN